MRSVSCVILFLLLFSRPASALIIVEVQIAGDQADHDYVRIHNRQSEDIDASGYRLVKKSSTGREYSLRVFPRETIIPARSYLTWANSRSGFAESIEAELASTAALAADNSIALLDSEKEILSALGWGQGRDPFEEGAGLPNPQPHQQIKRRQTDGYYVSTGSNLEDFYLTEMPTVEIPLASHGQTPKRRAARPFSGLILAAAIMGLFSVKLVSYYQNKTKP